MVARTHQLHTTQRAIQQTGTTVWRAENRASCEWMAPKWQRIRLSQNQLGLAKLSEQPRVAISYGVVEMKRTVTPDCYVLRGIISLLDRKFCTAFS